MTSTNCIFSVNTPPQDWFGPCIEMTREYCQKYSLEYFLLTEPRVNWRHHWCERLYFIELLKQYDRVLYIDADVMPLPHAPNIFEVFPGHAFCAFDENFGVDPMSRDEYVLPLLGRVPWWEKNSRGLYRFFNAGVMLSSKEHLPAFEEWRNTPDEPSLWFPWPEQTYLNYMVNAGKLPFVDMGQEWNRMSMGLATTREDRVRANFVHYAGPVEYHGYSDKALLIREDFDYFRSHS